MRAFLRTILQFAASVALFLVVRSIGFEMYKIPTGSMQGTLLVGDFLVVNKAVYGSTVPFTHVHIPAYRAPQRGDIIVFKYPVDVRQNFVKRVVGIPGDTLRMKDGVLYRNGLAQAEPYARHIAAGLDLATDQFRWQRDYLISSLRADDTYWPSRNDWGPLIVPPANYFVLGDNRDNSADSRYWGFVPDSLVRGTPMFVYYSYDPDSSSRLSWLERARWRRIGTIVR